MSANPLQVSRRAFVGGLVIAITLPACKQSPKSSGETKIIESGAWLRIGTDDSITFLCDRSEMGQGVYTSLPMLIAEELGVALAAHQGRVRAARRCVHQQHDRRPDHRRQHQRARRVGKTAQGGRNRASPCW